MATVNSMEGLKRVQTKAGGRWYDIRTGKFVRLEVKARDPFEDRVANLAMGTSRFVIELKDKSVKIHRITEGKEEKLKKVFDSEEQALEAFQGLVASKIRSGYREWSYKARKRRIGPSAKIANIMRTRKKQARADKPLVHIEVPPGYIEIAKSVIKRFDDAIGHSAEFVKLSKKSIKDLRKVIKAKKYQNVEYMITVALDSFEDKTLTYARWARKRQNQITRLVREGNAPNYMIKKSNMSSILDVAKEIVGGIGALVKYEDILKPRRKPTIRFLEEAKKVYYDGARSIREIEELMGEPW